MNELRLTLFCVLAVAATMVYAEMKEITGFNIPDYDEKNNLESQLSGAKARFLTDDRIEIDALKIESFDNGKVEMTVTSPHCIYHRDAKKAESESSIRIERENMVITGSDYEYNSGKELFKIQKDVKVVLANRDVESTLGED